MSKFILIGMSGSGKTTVGKAAAEKTGLKFIDIDEEIERKHGKISRIFNESGEEQFREYESKEFESALSYDNTVVSTGGGILGKPENRKLASSGTVIFIDRDLDGIKMSLDDSNRPMVKNKPGMLEKLYKERYGLYKDTMDFMVSNNGTRTECIDAVVALINGKRNS